MLGLYFGYINIHLCGLEKRNLHVQGLCQLVCTLHLIFHSGGQIYFGIVLWPINVHLYVLEKHNGHVETNTKDFIKRQCTQSSV